MLSTKLDSCVPCLGGFFNESYLMIYLENPSRASMRAFAKATKIRANIHSKAFIRSEMTFKIVFIN